MQVTNRSEIDGYYQEVFEGEKHHEHLIVNHNGIYRWLVNEEISQALDSVNLNDVIIKLYEAGFNKNSEIYRQMYRSMVTH